MKSLLQKDKSLRQKFLNKEINQKIVVYSFRKLLNSVKYSKKKKEFFLTFYLKNLKKSQVKPKL